MNNGKVIIYNKFDTPKTEPTPSGSRYAEEYTITTNKETGERELTKTGTTDIYAMIQEALEPTKIENILKRYAATGDESVLNERKGMFIDITEAPTSIMDALNTIEKTKKEFEKLPSEIKEKFANSPEQFMAEIATGKGFEKLQTKAEAEAPRKEEIKE